MGRSYIYRDLSKWLLKLGPNMFDSHWHLLRMPRQLKDGNDMKTMKYSGWNQDKIWMKGHGWILTNTTDSKTRCTRSIRCSAFSWTFFPITWIWIGNLSKKNYILSEYLRCIACTISCCSWANIILKGQNSFWIRCVMT